jgi:hypothetical protein
VVIAIKTFCLYLLCAVIALALRACGLWPRLDQE